MNDYTLIEKEFGDLSAFLEAPPFWISTPKLGRPFIEKLKQGTVHTIGRSAGGREIVAIEYGEKEPHDAAMDNLQSALASNLVPPDPTDIFPDSFFGKTRRRKPVVALQGGIHGSELTGTVASFNLCHLLETGKDLRGKEWPRLLDLARKTRLCIIPWVNVDGAERTRWPNSSGMPAKAYGRMTQGIAADGRKYEYPAVKSICPIPPDKTAFMGTYYNDAGVNLQYDFCAVRRQPETTAWMEYYLAERPDGVAVWHCNAGSLMGPPPFYIPVGYQMEEARLAGALRNRLLRDGYPAGRMSWAGLPGMGKPYLEQITAIYHVCGALPLLLELPAGCKEWELSCDAMLDIGLISIEEILFYAHTDGLRPYENWEKVCAKLGK